MAKQLVHNRLNELKKGERRVIERLELPNEVARRMMTLGFLPGAEVSVGHTAPGGDPKVFRIDGTEIALRKEVSCRIVLASHAAHS